MINIETLENISFVIFVILMLFFLVHGVYIINKKFDAAEKRYKRKINN